MAISSGARGTAGQQQDRRNAADRAAGSSMGGRGTMGQQQDRRNAATAQRAGNTAPGVERMFNPRDPVRGSPPTNMRRTANPTPSYDMSLHNMYELSKALPGPMMGPKVLGGALGLGTGPNFTGYRGNVQGPGDYDPQNRFGTPQGGFLQQQMAQYQRPMQRPAMPAALAQRPMPYGQAPGLNLGSGLQGYSAYRPGYSFINGPFR